MNDEALRILIQKYDPEMENDDIDYLMSHEDRECVISTICAKILERQQEQARINHMVNFENKK